MKKKHEHTSVHLDDLCRRVQDNHVEQLSLQQATYHTTLSYYNGTFQRQGCGFPADAHTFSNKERMSAAEELAAFRQHQLRRGRADLQLKCPGQVLLQCKDDMTSAIIRYVSFLRIIQQAS